MTERGDADKSDKLEHFVSEAPFDAYSVDQLTPEQERFYMASQWQMMWWKFRRHHLAVAAGVFLLIMYGTIVVSEFLSPYDLHSRDTDHLYAPPQAVQLFHDGELRAPFVYGFKYELDMENLQRIYTRDESKIYTIRWFCLGDSYDFWGFIPMSFHVYCPAENGTLFLLGTDRLGRDMLSRIISGARISLTVGLFGIIMSFILGITIDAVFELLRAVLFLPARILGGGRA